jgi:hypothetical protein
LNGASVCSQQVLGPLTIAELALGRVIKSYWHLGVMARMAEGGVAFFGFILSTDH